MIMTNKDIAAEYKAAKYKDKQISILADQNCCTSAEIREILESEGIELPKKRGKKKAELKAEKAEFVTPEIEPISAPKEEPKAEKPKRKYTKRSKVEEVNEKPVLENKGEASPEEFKRICAVRNAIEDRIEVLKASATEHERLAQSQNEEIALLQSYIAERLS